MPQATTIEKYLAKATRNNINTKSKEAILWFRDTVKRTMIDPSSFIREEKGRLVNSWTNAGLGKMYLAYYDPKHKETLPYYDTFPLIIPIEKYDDGFLGLNLHYLPPVLRAKLLGALYDTLNNDTYNEKTKMLVTYNILKAAKKFKYFQPCLKRYLGSHFRSRFIKVEPEAWALVTFLPVEQFEKKRKNEVWQESRKMI